MTVWDKFMFSTHLRRDLRTACVEYSILILRDH